MNIQDQLAELRQLIVDIKSDIDNNLSPWMNKEEAAAYLGMDKRTLTRYMDSIPHSRATGRPKFHRDDLDAFMESQKIDARK